MNTPPVDAEGVFFCVRAHAQTGGGALRREHASTTVSVRTRQCVARPRTPCGFTRTIVPVRACFVAFCGAKQARILQVATRKKIPPKY